MTWFWLFCIDRIVPNCLYFVLSAIIIAGLKLYLFDIFIHPPFFGGVLL